MSKHIVSFSGGKDSTAMLLMMIERDMPIDEIVFCDTGVEFPEMYEHIEKVKEYTKLDITVLKPQHTFEHYLGHIVKVKGKFKGEKGYGWTGHNFRWCTNLMKIRPSDKYFKNKDVILYIGIAKDEENRTNRKEYSKRKVLFPLVDFNITEKQALDYCYDRGFDWGGLYNQTKRVSCWLCPLQPIASLRSLYNNQPELWAELKRLDKLSYRQFRSDYSVDQLEEKFK